MVDVGARPAKPTYQYTPCVSCAKKKAWSLRLLSWIILSAIRVIRIYSGMKIIGKACVDFITSQRKPVLSAVGREQDVTLMASPSTKNTTGMTKTYLCERTTDLGAVYCTSFEASGWDEAEEIASERGWKLIGEYVEDQPCPDEMMAMIERSVTGATIH